MNAIDPHVILIDGNSLVARAIMATALDDLKAGGIWTGGLYGALSSLASLLSFFEDEGRPAAEIFMAFDVGAHPERKQLIPEYKSERKERRELMTPDEKEKAFQQVTMSHEMFANLGVRILRFTDREADDVVAGMSKLCGKHGAPSVVVSGDRDLFQCVAFGSPVWYLSAKTWVNTENFVESTKLIYKTKLGIRPESYVLFRALTGDDSDSIHGVPGCGPVRAEQMIEECAKFVVENGDGADFFVESPEAQLSLLTFMIREHSGPVDKLPAFKRNLLDHEERISRVLQGIDLSASFGGLSTLEAAAGQAGQFNRLAALRFFTSLKFKSVVTEQNRFFGPFERAAKRGRLLA